MTIAQIRTALRNHFGSRMYRITKTGEIHVYGTMPNTSVTGWYLFGDADSTDTLARIESLS